MPAANQNALSRDSALLRKYPVGAEVVAGEGVHFRVWAPECSSLGVEICENQTFLPDSLRLVELEPESDRELPDACRASGYFSGFIAGVMPGTLYKFRTHEGSFPDPASRFQPEGPHGPSQVVDPSQYSWSDRAWRGLGRVGQVIYEMHIGTFTPEGTWKAAQSQFAELARIGITALEVMPVADFCGQFGWGYDGVNLFAPTRLYGSPDQFRDFVNAAHALGLGVILDVVYNHFGPDGNYLRRFANDYFTERHKCEWGDALNFDGPNSGPVREFFATNAAYWIEEFHLDGLRLDATQQMFDGSPDHILALISRAARSAAQRRAGVSPGHSEPAAAASPGLQVLLTAENEAQESRLIRPSGDGGYGLDAIWNDDFHHSAHVALTGHREAYYSDYRGTSQELVSAVTRGFLYQGQWSLWQKKTRGTPVFLTDPEQFILYLQNHDQVANSMRGLRIQDLTSPGRLRASTALLLLAPGTPLLFQGQEFAASTPFLFFADHKPELARLVAKGRGKFLSQFPSIAGVLTDQTSPAQPLADPGARQTFLKCKLDFSERGNHEQVYRLHCDLLKLRRHDPVFSKPQRGGCQGAVLGPDAFVLRFFGQSGADRLLLVNLGLDLPVGAMSEPLLAPSPAGPWSLIWSSEDLRYGGCGAPALSTDAAWVLMGHSAVLLASPEAP